MLKLRCVQCRFGFSHFIFSGDTDMATLGLCSLTALGEDELIIGELTADEFNSGTVESFQQRLSLLLLRRDLRAVRVLRWEERRSAKGVTFQKFQGQYLARKGVYSCPKCGRGEAREVATISVDEYLRSGGKITFVGDLGFRNLNT